MTLPPLRAGVMSRSRLLSFAGVAASPALGMALEMLTVASELALPILVLTPRFRGISTSCFVALFFAVYAVFELPPLFVALYMGGALVFRELPLGSPILTLAVSKNGADPLKRQLP